MSTLTLPTLFPESPEAEFAAGGMLYEVVRGQRVELPAMGIFSSWYASRLHGYLWPFADLNHLGTVVAETLFVLDPSADLRRRPDVAFVSKQRWPLDKPIPEVGDWEVVPDLAVEVVSPHDLFEAVLAKVLEYFVYQVKQVWVIAPRQRLVLIFEAPTQIRVLTDKDVLETALLPGFRLALNEFFRPAQESNGAKVGN